MSAIISFANTKAREDFIRSCRAREGTDNLKYISMLGESVVLENVSESMLQELRKVPEIEVYEDLQLEPFDASA